MLEQQRLDYLQAMGVVQWLPRRPLPYAPAPRWLPSAEVAPVQARPSFAHPGGHIAHPAANQLLRDAAASPRPSFSHLLDERAASEAPAPSVASHGDAVPAAARPVDDGRPPQFQLHFFRSTLPVIWVSDQTIHPQELSALIHSAQKALTGQSLFVPDPAVFRWPFILSPHEDQSTPVALQALRAQWQFLREQGGGVLLTFGLDSQYWLEQIGVSSHFHAGSVTELWQSAGEKRRLWLALMRLPETPA